MRRPDSPIFDTTPATRLAPTWQHGRHAGLRTAELPALEFDDSLPSLMHRVQRDPLGRGAPVVTPATIAARALPRLDDDSFVAAALGGFVSMQGSARRGGRGGQP